MSLLIFQVKDNILEIKHFIKDFEKASINI